MHLAPCREGRKEYKRPNPDRLAGEAGERQGLHVLDMVELQDQ
jgi:hypothetical protein